MAKELILFDIDGTLLSPVTHSFEDSTKQTLKQLRDLGYKLGVATGRAYHPAKGLGTFDLIDWDIIVLNNGQKVLDKNHEVIYEKKIDVLTIERFIDRAHELGIAVLGQGDHWHFYSKSNDYVKEVHQFLGDYPTQEEFDSSISIYSLMVYGYDYDFVNEFEELRYVHVTGPYADVTLASQNKYLGIKQGLKLLNVNDYIAFGDSANDLEMAMYAKIFVATHDANEVLLPHANYQIDSSHNEIEKGVRWLLNVL